MNTMLLGFGDSWAAGHDLEPGQKNYLELTAEKLGVPSWNFAVGSSSVSHMVLQFKNFIETVYHPKNQYSAVFFLTARERNFFYDQENKNIVHVSPSSTPAHPYYRIYNNEHGEFVFNTVILALQNLCQAYGVKDYYLPGWQIPALWTSVDRTKFWRLGKHAITDVFHDDVGHVPLQELLDRRPKNPNFGLSHDHPSQTGHQRIASELLNWISIDQCS